jgi:RHS repeat-associated protein
MSLRLSVEGRSENGATTGVGVLATYAYNDLGQRTSLTRGNGTVTSYAFDAASRLDTLTQNLAGTAQDLTLGFDYNPARQITSNTRSNDAYAWTDAYNVNRNYTSNGLNQYTQSGSVTPTYDTKGNLTSAGSTTYAYTSENLLKSTSTGITLDYDPLNRLYQTAGGTPGTTRFAYDGLDLIAEYDGANALKRRYVHGPGVDEPLVWYEGTGTTDRRWYHADERGSIVALTNASGTATVINSYDEYGIPETTNTDRFQYTGQTWIEEIGMYYYKARIYSPTLGRFLQPDPIGYAGGINLYAYAGNDPINFVDPLGLYEICWTTPRPNPPGYASTSYDDPQPGDIVVTAQLAPEQQCVMGIDYDLPHQGPTDWLTPIIYRSITYLVDEGREKFCAALSHLPEGTSLALAADAQGYGGIGGYLGFSAFVDRNGNTGFNISRGWGAGFGFVGGAGISLQSTPAPGRTALNQMQGGLGVGPGGGSVSYSRSGGPGGSVGISAGPDVGYAFGSVSGTSDTTAGGNICR